MNKGASAMSSEKSDFEEWCLKVGYTTSPSITMEIAKEAFEAGRAAKVERLSWPSEKDLEKEYFYNENIHMSEWETALTTYKWLKSQVKPFEMPSFADEEILSIERNVDYDGYDGEYSRRAFLAGFKTALELVRKKMEDV